MDKTINNTFENGMHQDNELVVQPKGTYRRSVNGRITSRNDGSYAWESIKGNTLEFQITVLEYELRDGFLVGSSGNTDFTACGNIEGKDKVFLFFVKSDGSLLIGYVNKEVVSDFTVIYYLRNTEANNKIFGREIFTFSQEKPVSGYSVYENAEIERIYFNNNDVPPLTLNIAPLLVNKYNVYQDEVNSLETAEYPWVDSGKLAKYYLVLHGAFMYNDIIAMPGDILTVSADNINIIVDSVSAGTTPIIVDFYPIQNAEFDPLLKFPEIGIEETITGALPCGNYVFAVSYYTKCHHYTNWSPLSRSVGVGKYFISPEPALKYKSVLDWQKYRGGEQGSISETGLKIVLKNTETIFDKVRIAAFLIDPLNNLSSGKIIAEKPIGNILYEGVLTDPAPTAQVDLTFEFTQYAGVDITIAEVQISTARVEKATDITSMLNYGILAGIQEESELSIGSKLPGSVTGLIQEIPGDVVDRLTADTLLETGGQALPHYPLSGLYSLDENGYVKKPTGPADNSVGHLLPGQYYEVFEATVIYPKGSSNQYAVGSRFRCKSSAVPSANDYNYTGGFVKPVFPVCKYRKVGGERVFDWIILDDQTGLKMSGNGLAGAWGNETYRIGFLPISLSGRPMYVRWIADWNTPERSKNADGTAFEIDALLNTYTNASKELVKRRGILGQKAPCENYTAMRYLYPLVGGLDITDIIDDISGFCIVVAPRDKKILSEGFIEPTVKQVFSDPDDEDGFLTLHVRAPGFNKCSGANDEFVTEDRSVDFDDKVYVYITPEHLFDPTFSYDLSSVLKPARIFNRNNNWPSSSRLEPPLNQYPSFRFDYEIFARKFYDQQGIPNDFDTIASCIRATQLVEGEQNIELINPSNITGTKSRTFWNIVATFLSETNSYAGGTIGPNGRSRGGRAILVELETPKNWNSLLKPDEKWDNDHQVLLVQQHKNRSGLYNNSPESFANTKYLCVGHYQQINDDFKSSIKNAENRYIVNDIQLTGLDCHVSLFDYTRSLVNGNTINYTTTVGGGGYYTTFIHQRGDTVIVPIQTSINIQSRNNRNSSYYKPSIAENGICLRKFVGSNTGDEDDIIEPDKAFLEEFHYNWSFSNRLGQDVYPGLPINLSRLNSYEMRFRWGNKKVYGELDDAFRKYPVLQFMDINGIFGKVNNIRPNGQHLLYWQDHCVGYIPIQERVMQSTVPGAYVQLGIGKAFEIYDELGKTFGNQDKLSLKEANEIFTWFDRTNRAIIMMDRSMKLTAKSKVDGLDYTLANMDLPVCPNAFPGSIGTVYSYYDYFKRILYMTFYLTGSRAPKPNNLTYGLDIEKGVINGEFEFAPDLGYSVAKQLRTIIGNKVYVHDEQSILLYGDPFESFIEIVVTGGSEQFVKFVNMICSGNENFFTKIRYMANYQFDSGLYLNDVEEIVDNRNYKRFLDDMRFSIPQGSRGRMESKAMVVRFTNEDPSKIVKLLKTSTSIILIT